MKKIIVAAFICLSLIACKQPDTNKVSATEIQTVNGSMVSPEVVPDELGADVNLFPKSNGLPLSVLITGTLHNDEASLDIVNKGWFGIFQDRGKYYISPTSVTIKQAYDPVLDDDENDASKWTGWEVKTSHIDTSLVLISGSPRFSEHQITTIPLEKGSILANSEMPFSFNGASYALYATATLSPTDHNTDEVVYGNYKLYIKGHKDGKEVNQLLASTSFFDDKIFKILLIGDIDNDGFPDLILDTSWHYNVYRPTIYLSSIAEKDELVRVVGLHQSVGC